MKKHRLRSLAVAAAMFCTVPVLAGESVYVTQDDWWKGWTPSYALEDGVTLTFDITETVAGYDTQNITRPWHSLNLVLCNVELDGTADPKLNEDYHDFVIIRSDNWAFHNTNTNVIGRAADGSNLWTYGHISSTGEDQLYRGDPLDFDYNAFLTDAEYHVTLSRDGNHVDYNIDFVSGPYLEGGKTKNLNIAYSIDFDDLLAEDLYVFFTMDRNCEFACVNTTGEEPATTEAETTTPAPTTTSPQETTVDTTTSPQETTKVTDPTAAPSKEAETKEDEKGSSNTKLIITLAAGGVLLVAVVIVAVLFFKKNRMM